MSKYLLAGFVLGAACWCLGTDTDRDVSVQPVPFSITITPVTDVKLPPYLDPLNHQPPPNGWASDFPLPSVLIDGEFWVIYKNG